MRMTTLASIVALIVLAGGCGSDPVQPDAPQEPVVTLAAPSTAGVLTTTTPPTTPTPPPTALQLDPQAFFEQEFVAAVGEECVYLYPGRGGIGRLVGMDETAARTKVERCGWVFRIFYRDGQALTITADMCNHRINAAIVNGVVVAVYKF